jgi:hypothetical protein
MSKLTKLYLSLGVVFSIAGILFNLDVINTSDIPALYTTLPVGAVFLGMFFICYMLGKESVQFDAEHVNRH